MKIKKNKELIIYRKKNKFTKSFKKINEFLRVQKFAIYVLKKILIVLKKIEVSLSA